MQEDAGVCAGGAGGAGVCAGCAGGAGGAECSLRREAQSVH